MSQGLRVLVLLFQMAAAISLCVDVRSALVTQCRKEHPDTATLVVSSNSDSMFLSVLFLALNEMASVTG
jgi:hypothetical protein